MGEMFDRGVSKSSKTDASGGSVMGIAGGEGIGGNSL